MVNNIKIFSKKTNQISRNRASTKYKKYDYLFNEINVGEIFRLYDNNNLQTQLYRKETETEAINVKTRKVFEFDDVKICIDIKSYLFLNGTEIDYEEDLFKSGLVFKNPKAKRTCGCGESIAF